MDRWPGAPIKPGFGLNGAEKPSPAPNLYCGIGLGVAVVAGVALGAIAGVAVALGVGCGAAVGDGVASCAGVPADVGDSGVAGVAATVGVGLAFACMFIAFLSVSFPSGPNTIWIPLFWLSLATSCGTATAYTHVDPTNLSPCLVTSQRA